MAIEGFAFTSASCCFFFAGMIYFALLVREVRAFHV